MINFKLVTNVNEANAITHNGKFHIDDVFSTVFLIKNFDNIKLARISEISEEENNNKIIFDIGKGCFDHHQINAVTRDDGIKYSSFGLLWKKYGREYLKKINCQDIEWAWKKFDLTLVKTIDKIDNFQLEEEASKIYLISNLIESFNPNWNDETDSNIKFEEAVEFCIKIFDNEISSIISQVEAIKYLKNISNENKEYIVLEKYIPYNDFIIENDIKKEIKFVIYPSKRNGYEIRTVFNRKNFPKEWCGLSEEEFFSKYKIRGMIYCHSNRKLCIASDLDVALKLIDLT